MIIKRIDVPNHKCTVVTLGHSLILVRSTINNSMPTIVFKTLIKKPEAGMLLDDAIDYKAESVLIEIPDLKSLNILKDTLDHIEKLIINTEGL